MSAPLPSSAMMGSNPSHCIPGLFVHFPLLAASHWQMLSAISTPAAPNFCAFLTLATNVQSPLSTMRMNGVLNASHFPVWSRKHGKLCVHGVREEERDEEREVKA